jgi:hypothetical protein
MRGCLVGKYIDDGEGGGSGVLVMQVLAYGSIL